jgi:hypothetical protein
MITKSVWKPTTSAIGIPDSSSRVAHCVTVRVMMMKVVMSLGMGAHECGARQGEKSDCLEEHVGWMMRLFVTKDVWCLKGGTLGSRGRFFLVVKKGGGKRCSRRLGTVDAYQG